MVYYIILSRWLQVSSGRGSYGCAVSGAFCRDGRRKEVAEMPVNSKAMGRRIKAARKKAAMTQARLAEEIGMSEVHVSNMESGTGNPSLATLVDIANVLSVSTDELLCDSVVCCKPVYQKEILETTADCDDYEIRVLSYILKAAKMAFRENRGFEKAA